jgi:hypothetical protein
MTANIWRNTRKDRFRTIFILAAGILLAVGCPPAQGLQAQDDPYYAPGFVRNDDMIYKENIATVLLHKNGFELSPPVIQLGTQERLFLSFDDFDGEVRQYRFTFIHCDTDWNTSQIQKVEYIEGFHEDDITDYQFSVNTMKTYINYVVVFPTDYMKITKSGNYILKVYDRTENDQRTIITRRFLVTDPKVEVIGKVNKTTNLEDRYTKQQVDFVVNAQHYSIAEPFRSLFVVVMQNGRWDNAIRNIQPRSVNGSILDYSLNEQIVFTAGNEFRYFDMKTLKYNTDRMLGIEYTSEGYQVYIQPDAPRFNLSYRTEEDINGRRLIASNDSWDSFTGADYARVNFYLSYPAPLSYGSFYVFGALSDWQFSPACLMKYNPGRGAYEASILLKQGYYNYAYAFLQNGSYSGDIEFVEGSFWETENEYTILVYYRQPGDFYDQLIGIRFLSTYSQ